MLLGKLVSAKQEFYIIVSHVVTWFCLSLTMLVRNFHAPFGLTEIWIFSQGTSYVNRKTDAKNTVHTW